MSVARLPGRVEDRLRRAELTYPEVGRSLGELPAGYQHLRRRHVIGTGPERFTHAAHQILTWQLHQRAGLRPQVSAPAAQPNAVLLLRIGTGRLAISAPCRVITVINEPRRQGFAYGTLPGHPEQGEEAITV
jgi:uncharacterized protein (UPF0548 family)